MNHEQEEELVHIFNDGDGLSMSTSVTVGDEDVLIFHWNSSKNLWIMENSDTK